MDARNALVSGICGMTGVLMMLLGGLAYFFFGYVWQIVIAFVGILLMLFALYAGDE